MSVGFFKSSCRWDCKDSSKHRSRALREAIPTWSYPKTIWDHVFMPRKEASAVMIKIMKIYRNNEKIMTRTIIIVVVK